MHTLFSSEEESDRAHAIPGAAQFAPVSDPARPANLEKPYTQ
jgi:hypothetical protein